MKRPDQRVRTERRGGGRNKLRKVGRILPSDNGKVRACIILDLSETGALLLVHDKVPDTFSLYHSAEKTLREATVVRRQQDTLGVRFCGEAITLQFGDPRLELLRSG